MALFKKKSSAIVQPLTTANDKMNNDTHITLMHSQQAHDIWTNVSTVDKNNREKKTCIQQCCTKENLKEQALLIATVLAVIIGIVVGIVLRQVKCNTGKSIDVYEITRR
jgi:ubiquinone biosynthesis protein Coq4